MSALPSHFLVLVTGEIESAHVSEIIIIQSHIYIYVYSSFMDCLISISSILLNMVRIGRLFQ